MVVESYNVRASAQRTYLSVESTTTTLKKEIVAPPKEETEPAGEREERAELSKAVRDMLERDREKNKKSMAKLHAPPEVKKTGCASKTPKSPQELKMTLLEMMLERLTGKKMRFRPQEPSGFSGQGEECRCRMSSFSGMGGQGQPRTVDAWETEQFRYESESVSYQAQGVVKTADGKTINVDISMYMSREFCSYTKVSVQSERQLCDPLVINYGGTAASLAGETFAFDLTMDGKTEQIHAPGEGSGFLAADWNGDGEINDGSELFGPQTGSGFDELRKYDGDGNGWIDENDEIFSKLVVWSRDKDGNDQLFTLKELDVGAIYLGDVETQFSFTDEENNTNGVMRSTSFFLKESGGAGTISHVDLSI